LLWDIEKGQIPLVIPQKTTPTTTIKHTGNRPSIADASGSRLRSWQIEDRKISLLIADKTVVIVRTVQEARSDLARGVDVHVRGQDPEIRPGRAGRIEDRKVPLRVQHKTVDWTKGPFTASPQDFAHVVDGERKWSARTGKGSVVEYGEASVGAPYESLNLVACSLILSNDLSPIVDAQRRCSVEGIRGIEYGDCPVRIP